MGLSSILVARMSGSARREQVRLPIFSFYVVAALAGVVLAFFVLRRVSAVKRQWGTGDR